MRYIVVVFTVAALVYAMPGVAMSILFGKEAVLFSPLEGRITFGGEPAHNAEIVRVIKWKDDTGETETYSTDQNGYFALPLKKRKVRAPPFAELVIVQSIFVRYAGQEVQIWGRTKRGIELYGELGGKPSNLRCELTDEVEYLDMQDGLFGTLCKWDGLHAKSYPE